MNVHMEINSGICGYKCADVIWPTNVIADPVPLKRNVGWHELITNSRVLLWNRRIAVVRDLVSLSMGFQADQLSRANEGSVFALLEQVEV